MNLLIVEDEDIIRQGLMITIQKLNFTFDCIYEAGDGEKGLRLCEEYMPDIIITDIRMPLMDGLTFIREAAKVSPDSQFIILSGYSDFAYARTALHYGVKDYLLKPSSKSEIQEVLSRVITQIQTARNAHRALKYQLDQFQQLLLGDILQNRYPAGEIENSLSRYSIQLPERGFFILCFHILPGSSSDMPRTDYKRHADWFSSVLSRSFQLFPADILANYHCLIASPLSESCAPILPVMKKLADETESYQAQADIRIHFSFTHMEQNVENLPALYKEAAGFLFCRFFHPEYRMLYSENCANNCPSLTVPEAMSESLYHHFIGKSRFDLRQDFLNLLRYLAALPGAAPHSFISGLEQVFHRLTVTLIRENRMPKQPVTLNPSVWETFSLCSDTEELFETLTARLMEYREAILRDSSSVTESALSPIDRAISYIDRNYYKELDLTLISRLISMNSSYFSSQFKKRTGLSFSTYLQNIRLEKSKNLLLNSNRKLYEISESVGINNVKYFCKLFKDYTGMTPTEFRRQSEGQKRLL